MPTNAEKTKAGPSTRANARSGYTHHGKESGHLMSPSRCPGCVALENTALRLQRKCIILERKLARMQS